MKRRARERLPKRNAGSFPSYLCKSLDELEGAWGPAPPGSTGLVEECHAIHLKPLLILSDQEVALCLRQRIGLTWLRTLVIQRLRQDPLRLSDVNASGDLLRDALLLPRADWGDMTAELREIADAIVPQLPETPDYLPLVVAHQSFITRS